jgi:hypoxanthine-guanine phosphoribosyltransferase
VKPLLDAAQLSEGVARLARQISRDYAGRSPSLIDYQDAYRHLPYVAELEDADRRD